MKKITKLFLCVFVLLLTALSGCRAESEVSAPEPTALSETVYPEYILLSENHWEATRLFSPIDRAYNKSRLVTDFIDSYANEFVSIWRLELDYQYAKCLNNMPEKHKKEFAAQQSAWEAYFDNDVFPEIAFFEGTGYGYTREAFLIRLDRVRRRTIEIMRIQTHIEGISVAFSDKVSRPIIALLEEENPKYTGEGIWIRAIEAAPGEAAMSEEDFFKLCLTGTPHEVEAAIQGGADVNAKSDKGNRSTPLMYAAAYNSAEVLNVLIKAGANVNARDNDGRTALDYAGEKKREAEILNILVQAELTRSEAGYVRLAIKGTNVNLRPGPRASGSVVVQMNTGDVFIAEKNPVTSDEDNSRWYKIVLAADAGSNKISALSEKDSRFNNDAVFVRDDFATISPLEEGDMERILAARGGGKYILENREVYRVTVDGTRRRIDDVKVETGAEGTVLWFAVDHNMNEDIEGRGFYFFDDKEKPLFFLFDEYPGMVHGIYFSPDGKQMVVDDGTWVVRQLILYDVKKVEKKTSLRGMSGLIWLDSRRFAFTMVEPDAEPPRDNGLDFNGWTSVVVYDTETGKIIPVMKATETQDYMLVGADLGKGELRISETSVRTKDDWPDYKKYQKKEITVKAP